MTIDIGQMVHQRLVGMKIPSFSWTAGYKFCSVEVEIHVLQPNLERCYLGYGYNSKLLSSSDYDYITGQLTMFKKLLSNFHHTKCHGEVSIFLCLVQVEGQLGAFPKGFRYLIDLKPCRIGFTMGITPMRGVRVLPRRQR